MNIKAMPSRGIRTCWSCVAFNVLHKLFSRSIVSEIVIHSHWESNHWVSSTWEQWRSLRQPLSSKNPHLLIPRQPCRTLPRWSLQSFESLVTAQLQVEFLRELKGSLDSLVLGICESPAWPRDMFALFTTVFMSTWDHALRSYLAGALLLNLHLPHSAAWSICAPISNPPPRLPLGSSELVYSFSIYGLPGEERGVKIPWRLAPYTCRPF